MKIISRIKSHKVIFTLVAAVIISGAGGVIYATNQPKPEVKEVASSNTQPLASEVKPVDKTEPAIVEEKPAPTQQSTNEAEPTTPVTEDPPLTPEPASYQDYSDYAKSKYPAFEANTISSILLRLPLTVNKDNYEDLVDEIYQYKIDNPNVSWSRVADTFRMKYAKAD